MQHSLGNAAGWLTQCMVCLPISPTPLGRGGAKSTVSPVFVQGPSQPVIDSMRSAVGCNALVHSPLFSMLIIVQKKKKADIHAGFTSCLQDLSSLAVLDILEIHIIHS